MKQKKMPLFLAAFTVFLLNVVLFTSCKTATTTKKYVVSYRSNILDDKTTIKDAGNPPEAIMVDEGTVLTLELLPELFYKGYTFLGWNYQSKQGVEKAEVNYTKVTKNLLLTAQWQKNAVPGDNGSDQSDSDDSDDTGTSDDDTPSPSNFVNKVCYTVNHYKQNLENNEYTVFPETLAGVVGEQTNAAAKDYAGFTLVEPVKQQKIKNDGTTVVDIYYDRNTVTINFVLDGGTTTTPLKEGSLSGKFGAPISIETPIPNDKTKTFVGWSKMLPSTFTMEADGQTYIALYGNGSQSTYTLRYWFQNIENDEYSTREGYEPETWLGFRNQLSMATAKDIYGFTAKTIAQKIVQEDNSTVVDVYYDRNIYTITFDLNYGTTTTQLGEGNTITGRYESVIQEPENIQRTYSSFIGFVDSTQKEWSGGTILKNDTIKAVFESVVLSYTVNHYRESATTPGVYDLLFKTETKEGLSYEETDAQPVINKYVVALSFDQIMLDAENKIVNIYYKPTNEKVVYKFYDSDGVTEINKIEKSYYSNYEEFVPTLPDGVTNYTWEPSVIPTIMEEDKTFVLHYGPQKLTVNYVRASYDTLKIIWENPVDSNLDHVKIVIAGGETYDNIPAVSGETQQYNITGLSKGTHYEVSFYTCYADGNFGKPLERTLSTCFDLPQGSIYLGSYAINKQINDPKTITGNVIGDATNIEQYYGYIELFIGAPQTENYVNSISNVNIQFSSEYLLENEKKAEKIKTNGYESIDWDITFTKENLPLGGSVSVKVDYTMYVVQTVNGFNHSYYKYKSVTIGTLEQENAYWAAHPEIVWQ